MAENLSQFFLSVYRRRLIIPYPEIYNVQAGNASLQVVNTKVSLTRPATMLNVHLSFRAERQSPKRVEKMEGKTGVFLTKMHNPFHTISHHVKEWVGVHIIFIYWRVLEKDLEIIVQCIIFNRIAKYLVKNNHMGQKQHGCSKKG